MNTFRIALKYLSEIMNPVRHKLSNVISSSLSEGMSKLENIPDVFIELLLILGVFIILLLN